MTYRKKTLDAVDLDNARVHLSVQERKLSPEPVCDFCGDPPRVVYASSRMSTGVFMECWRWMACGRCERLVDANDWGSVQRRVVGRFKKFFPMDVSDTTITLAVRAALDEFHEYAVKEA